MAFWIYVRDHLRGDQSLGKAFWINTVAVFAVFVLSAYALDYASAGGDDIDRLTASLLRDAIAAIVALWSLIGLWNSAARAGDAKKSAGRAAAKLFVIIAAVSGLHFLVTTAPGRIVLLSARLDPSLADYTIARTGPEEVVFTGALNDRSIRELGQMLSHPGIKVLRMTSHGGLVIPVMELAEIISRRKIAVVAMERCLSSCTLLLAASNNAIATPGTVISFHRPGTAIRTGMASRDAIAIATAEWHERFRRYGIPANIVGEMARRDVWTPGLGMLADIGMIKFILDGRPPRLVAAKLWCRERPDACGPGAG